MYCERWHIVCFKNETVLTGTIQGRKRIQLISKCHMCRPENGKHSKVVAAPITSFSFLRLVAPITNRKEIPHYL
jgi:hypothetical protein